MNSQLITVNISFAILKKSYLYLESKNEYCTKRLPGSILKEPILKEPKERGKAGIIILSNNINHLLLKFH